MVKFLVANYAEVGVSVIFVLVVVLAALHRLGWLKVSPNQAENWDGTERRECAQHSGLSQKVCSLYTKIDSIDGKLDSVAEKVQYILGKLENFK